MRRQEIHVQNMDEGVEVSFPRYGVELRPPLSDLAAAGLCAALKMRRSNKEEVCSAEPDAREAVVTRNDEEGTVLVIQPNDDIPSNALSSGLVGLWVGSSIDPTNKLERVFYLDGDTEGITEPI